MKKSLWIDNADVALYAVLSVWFVYVLNYLILPHNFTSYGIRPRELAGLWGILFCPFLHKNLAHIIANSLALFVLLSLSLSFSRRLTLLTIILVLLLGGVVVWFLGDPKTNYIGASGIIFGLIGFLMSIGFFRGEWMALILSVVILVLYGGTLLTLVYSPPGTSWLAHFAGFVTGVLSAWWTRELPRD